MNSFHISIDDYIDSSMEERSIIDDWLKANDIFYTNIVSVRKAGLADYVELEVYEIDGNSLVYDQKSGKCKTKVIYRHYRVSPPELFQRFTS